MWSIELSDGTKYEGLTLNGNNFISESELTAEMFPPQKLRNVKIEHILEESEKPYTNEDGHEVCPFHDIYGLEGEHAHMKLVAVGPGGEMGNYRLILRDYTPLELREARRDSNIEYIAMMTGVEL